MLRRGWLRLGKRLSFCYRNVRFEPEPKKKDLLGEDAFLSLYNVQAVLDGVSWWKENTGVSAGLYSAALARTMFEYVMDELLGDAPASSLRLLERAYESCKHGEVFGTCTVLVATLQEPQMDVQLKDTYELVMLDGPSFKLPPDLPQAPASATSSPAAEEASLAAVVHASVGDGASSGDGGDAPYEPVPFVPTTLDLQTAFTKSRRTDGYENFLLDVAYVGDCALMLIRRGKIMFMTEEQGHSLDYPRQLGTGSSDTPKESIRRLIAVEKGDLLIMGSDGIFDNLYPHQIVAAMWPPLEKVYRQHKYISFSEDGSDKKASGAAALAEKDTGKKKGDATPAKAKSGNPRTQLMDDIMEALVKAGDAVMQSALVVSQDVHCDSPYASKCLADGALYEGGKPDDMTLVTSVIAEYDDDDSGERFSTSETAYPPPYRDWP